MRSPRSRASSDFGSSLTQKKRPCPLRDKDDIYRGTTLFYCRLTPDSLIKLHSQLKHVNGCFSSQPTRPCLGISFSCVFSLYVSLSYMTLDFGVKLGDVFIVSSFARLSPAGCSLCGCIHHYFFPSLPLNIGYIYFLYLLLC